MGHNIDNPLLPILQASQALEEAMGRWGSLVARFESAQIPKLLYTQNEACEKFGFIEADFKKYDCKPVPGAGRAARRYHIDDLVQMAQAMRQDTKNHRFATSTAKRQS